jgi:serine-type D-Ala-D-Ala carboxypeptidase/endopeptidase (penicillin-binding protein 4)
MKRGLIYFLLFLPILSAAQNPSKIQVALGEFSEAPELKYASVSFILKDQNNKTIASLDPDRSVIPASNLKLITTAVALEMLGDTFRFQTKLGFKGIINNKTLTGNILIVGDGDPTLGSNRCNPHGGLDELAASWVKEITASGIKKVNGRVIADIGNYELNTIPDGWIWTDIGNYYGAGAAGININENFYRLYFRPGKSEGDSCALLRSEPVIPGLKFINEMKTGKAGSGDNGYIYGGIFSEQRFLSGTLPAGVNEFSIKGSIPDPAWFAAYYLTEKLKQAGVEVTGGPEVWKEEEDKSFPFTVLNVYHSPALSEIVRQTNMESINLYAEALLKKLGSVHKKSGSTLAGTEVIYDWLKQTGIDSQGMFVTDGSGLSPANAIRASGMADLLIRLKGNKAFVASLPVAGVSGTLSGFCKGTKAEGKIIAKSGSFKRIIGYSGYVKNSNGQLLPFAIFVNNYNCSSATVKKLIAKLLAEAL